MPSTTSAGNQAAEQLYAILSQLYTTLNAAGLEVSTVPVVEPPGLQQAVLSAVQAIRTS
jgi:hypothetical protein